MARGDHLIVPLVCGTTHHAIDLGDGTVIHWSGIWRGGPLRRPDQMLAKAHGEIRRESYEQFARDLEVTVQAYADSHDPDVVVSRAESRLGERGYHLVDNNCEHFAVWCKTGRHHSPQVWTVHRIVQRAASVVTRFGVGRSTKLAVRGLSRSATPWLLAAEGAQLVTELTVARMHPQSPEKAEQLGRKVGLLASMGAGALTGTVAGPVGAALGAMAGAGTWVAGDKAGQKAADWVKAKFNQ